MTTAEKNIDHGQFYSTMDERFMDEFSQRIKEEATDLLNEKLPDIAPEGDSKILLLDEFPHEGGYCGMWNGEHNIVLKNSFGDLVTEDAQRKATQRAVHELMHQKFVESVGMEDIFGSEVIDFLNSPEIERMSDGDIALKVVELANSREDEFSDLVWGLTETISFLGEKYLGFDDRDFKDRFIKKSVYPENVKSLMIAFDESVKVEEIPELLEKLLDVVGTQRFTEIIGDKGKEQEILDDPLKLLGINTY